MPAPSRSLVRAAAFLALMFPSLCCGQQDDAPEVTPADGGQMVGALRVPDGAKPAPPEEELVLHTPAGGEPRVVRVLSELGDARLVKQPTGALAVVPRAETSSTDRPFEAAGPDEIAASLREDGLTDYKIVEAGYYLFAYDSTEAYYLHTRSILESMLSGVVKQLAAWGIRPQRPETPLVVVIMPSRAAFDAFHKMPDGVAAYYDGVSNRVILYEDERLFDSAPEFALKQGAYVVAHESIHQLLANTGIQRRLSSWPAWISEGVPEYFCPLKVHSSLARTDGDELPVRTVRWTEAGMVNDLRMHDLLRTPGDGGDVIREVVGAPGLTAHGYSVAWGLVHYLAEKRTDAFKAYLADVATEAPLGRLGADTPRGPDPRFVKHFGDDFAQIERDVQRHLNSRRMRRAYSDPHENQTHYVVSVTFKRGRVYYTQADVLLSPDAARKWTAERRRALDADGIDAHILTRECRTQKEALFHLRKIAN